MNTRFKAALNDIKADEALRNKTEEYLKSTLAKEQNLRMPQSKTWRMMDMKKFAIAACMAVLLIGGGVKAYATPLTYVSIDINPSVELGVNALNQVVSAEGYNEDGKKVLDGIKVKGQDVSKAVKAIVDSADDKGYIAKDGSTVVAVTAVTDNDEKADKLKEKARKGAEEALKENGRSADVRNDKVALARRDEARELGISPGKLNLIQKLQASAKAADSEISAADLEALIGDYKDAPVKEIMKAIKSNRGNGTTEGNIEKEPSSNKDKGASEENKGKGTLNNKGNDSDTDEDEGNANNNKGNANNKGKGVVNSKAK